jgi:monoamine oxidase
MPERRDVVVVGAGLAGLSCARDLARAGTDVLVLEARERPGGRVDQFVAPDGRVVQTGGEVIAEFHTSYLELVRELGLTVTGAFPSYPGELTWGLVDGTHVGDVAPWLSATELAAWREAERRFCALAGTVDPDDPWSHPDADRLDGVSIGEFLRDNGVSAGGIRMSEVMHLGLAADSVWRTSLLSELRKAAVAGATGFYDEDVWETHGVAEGSATVARRLAEGLAERVRYGAPVVAIDVGRAASTVRLTDGTTIDCSAVVSAVPAGPLRDIAINGISDARLASLHALRHAVAIKLVALWEESWWLELGRDGFVRSERDIGCAWPQLAPGVLSVLVPPDRVGPYLATAPAQRRAEVAGLLTELLGRHGLEAQLVEERLYAVDPWTQGYITGWRPGDVMRVGPLHATHEPPFYVCGSDFWVCGYMDGAVRTGRAAAAALLREGTASSSSATHMEKA